MRLLHLVGLRRANGERVEVQFDAPLVLPWWISEPDREVILAFVQQAVAKEPLQRVEVDCDTFLVPSDRALLRELARRNGNELLLVVRIRGAGVRLEDVLRDPEIAALRHVVLVADRELTGATVGALAQLCALAMVTAEETYEMLSDGLGLPPGKPDAIRPLVRMLLNPVVVCEAYNALIRAHLESVHRARALEPRRPTLELQDSLVDAVQATVLGRLLDGLDAGEAVALAKLAAPRDDADRAVDPDTYQRLRERLLVRGRELQRWARLLETKLGRDLLRARLARLAAAPALDERTRTELRDRLATQDVMGDVLVAEAAQISRWLKEGQIDRAREALARLQPSAGASKVGLADVEVARGDLARLDQREDVALSHFERASALLRDTDHFSDIANVELQRALSLVELHREDQAIAAFAHARTLSEQCGTRGQQAWVLHQFGAKLAPRRWAVAEALLRDALALADTDQARVVVLMDLARGLKSNSTWQEAESCFKAATAEAERVGDPRMRAWTLIEYGRALRDERAMDASAEVLRSAVAAAHQGADRVVESIALGTLGHVLMRLDRVEEATRVLRDAVNLDMYSGADTSVVVLNLCALAGALVLTKHYDEATRCFESIVRIEVRDDAAATAMSSTAKLALTMLKKGFNQPVEALMQRLYAKSLDKPAA